MNMPAHKRWVPNLWYRHRGFALVATGLAVWHLIMAFDSFFLVSRLSTSAVWRTQAELLPYFGWGVLHTIILVMMVVGAYLDRKDLRLVREACLASISTFTFLGGCVLYVFLWPAHG